MNSQLELIECPICMDCIDTKKNCVTTECGHCFHTNCLMTSVAHNGFGCPYCRSVMAEEPELSDDDESEYDSDSDSEASSSVTELYDDYSLRGMRFLFRRVDGLDEDEEDEQDDEDEDEDIGVNVLNPRHPSVENVIHQLVGEGVTIEKCIKALLSYHDEYYHNTRCDIAGTELWDKLRSVITGQRADEPIPLVEVQPIAVDESASGGSTYFSEFSRRMVFDSSMEEVE